MIKIPTIIEIKQNLVSAVEAKFNFTIPKFGKVFLNPFLDVLSAVLKLFYLAVSDLIKNVFVDTADIDQLSRWGFITLGRLPFAATFGEYMVSITGSVGNSIPQGTTFTSPEGYLFILDSDVILSSSSVTIKVRALTGGTISILNVGEYISSTSPLQIDDLAVVVSIVIEPKDAENLEAYRKLVIQSFRLEPNGGSGSDYYIWALIQGIQNVYPFNKEGSSNEINVFVEGIVNANNPKGLVSSIIIQEVVNNINNNPLTGYGRKPLTVLLNVISVTAFEIDIIINNYESISDDIKNKIFSDLTTSLKTVRPFVGSIDSLASENDILTKNKIISLIQVSNPPGVFGNVNLVVNGSSIEEIRFMNGNIPYLKSIVYA